MLVLALDTSSLALSCAVCELKPGRPLRVLAESLHLPPTRHGDLLPAALLALLVKAGLSLDELSELTGQDFTRVDVQTVGGLVFELLGHVPRNGERFDVGEFRFVVERVVKRRIERVYLERLAATG